ncbi:hypothetical protein B0J14DRAFT_707881 [Halenospora varia]|nr:hypothetical protein B0J14DRAFT_707881 [Halenospora varia]
MVPRAIHEHAGPRSAPPPGARRERLILSARDLCVGCIVWLPERNIQQISIKCDKSICCGQSELGDGGYDHPVVVLSIKQRHGSTTIGDLKCSVACVTSFTETKLHDYLRQRHFKTHLQQFLPIRDPEGADITSFGLPYPPQLHLERGRKLHKQSYVGLQHSYNVPLGILRGFSTRCRAYKLRLEEESYKVLMRELGMAPETYPETNTLFETGDARLTALARPMGRLNHVFVNPRPATGITQNAPHYTPSFAPYTAPASHAPSSPHYGATPQTANVTYSPSHWGTVHAPTATNQPSRPPIRYNSTTQHHPQCRNWSCSGCASHAEPDGSDVGFSVLCIIAFVAIGFWVWRKSG